MLASCTTTPVGERVPICKVEYTDLGITLIKAPRSSMALGNSLFLIVQGMVKVFGSWHLVGMGSWMSADSHTNFLIFP